jgi:hypothetical protein
VQGVFGLRPAVTGQHQEKELRLHNSTKGLSAKIESLFRPCVL